ncbi:MAG: hypothetical protein II157_02520, partial [Bacteroidales bacterium]|nr:hypothetical protein [Bacteroidales bacterium]
VIMSFTNLEKQLRFSVPEELYDIAPGQVAYFIPLKGISLDELNKILNINFYLKELHKDVVKFTLVPTDNVSLIDLFAGRGFQEINTPYSVVLGDRETIAGFASQFFGDNIEDVVQATISFSIRRQLSISSENKPIVVEIDPRYRPAKESANISGDSSDDPGMELLQKRPETEKEKKDLVAKYEQKFRKMLWECAYLGIDLNINGIVEEVELNKTKTEGYGLSLQMKQNEKSGVIDCKVFVGDGLEMKVTAVRKAVYLAFLSLEDGLVIEEATPAFTKRIQNIYRRLPEREEKEENEGGLLYVDYIQSKTLRGYMSDINSAIAKLVPNGLIAIDLGIEGLKEGAFKVMRSTPEIRKQIIQAFNL